MNKQSVRLLIVDDNESILEVLSKRFQESHSYVVDVATDSDEAWKIVAQAEKAYDVALIDNVLPEFAGDEPHACGLKLMRRVKNHSPQTEVIIFTGWGMEDTSEAIREGAYRYLSKPFSFDELAAIINQAVEYNQLKSAEYEKYFLNQLINTSTELLSCQSQEKVVDCIIRGVKAIGFDRVRLYLLSEDGQLIVRIVQAGFDDDFNRRYVYINDDPYLQAIIDDPQIHRFKHKSDDSSPIESHDGHNEAAEWIGTPLRYSGNMVAILSADKKFSNKPITDEELGALSLLASQAAIALVNAEFLSRDEKKLKRLEKLSLSINEIMSNFRTWSFDALLDLVARHTAEILEAKVCGVYHVKRLGVLSIEASFGHEEGNFYKGMEFEICSAPGSGLTGHVAYTGELFNKYGHELTSHFAVRKYRRGNLHPKECYSVLAIPLKKDDRVIGVLRVEDKKGEDGHPHPNLGFTTEDEWILSIFADAVFVTIETAELLEQLRGEKDYKDSLVQSSPDGIIAIDRKGNVLAFNKRAQEILDYKPEEVIKKIPVEKIYYDEKEPRRIGALLHENYERNKDPKLPGHDTFVRSKSGEKIPIRLSSSWLFDAEKRIIGSVGYFEDLRTIKEIEQRLDMFLSVSEIMIRTAPLSDRLQEITRMMMSVLPHTFCRILITDESTGTLRVAAHYLNSDLAGMEAWDSKLDDRFSASDWPGLDKVLRSNEHTIIEWKDRKYRKFLYAISRKLGFKQSIQTMLVVPLKSEYGPLGLLEIGEIRSEDQVPVKGWEATLVSAVAAQITVVIKADQRFEKIERERAAAESIAKLTTMGNIDATLDFIVRQTSSIVRCDVLVLYEYDSSRNKLRYPPKQFGVPDPDSTWLGRDIPPGSLVNKMLTRDSELIVENTADTPPFNNSRFAKAEGIKSLVVHPLRVAGRKVGVMFVNYKSPHSFTRDELNNIKLFADQAAVAIASSQHYIEATNSAKGFELLHRADQAITSSLDLEATLNEIAQQTLEVIEERTKTPGAFIHIAYLKDNILSFIASSSDDIARHLKPVKVDINDTHSRLWIAGRAAKEGRSLNVGNVLDDDDYYPIRSDVKSQLSVPMKIVEQDKGERVIGVLSIEHPDLNAFSDEDVRIIELLAAQAAIAIRNARFKHVTEAVTRKVLIGDITFPSLAAITNDIIGSDATVLYEYDETKKTLMLPPGSDGLINPDNLTQKQKISKDSLIYGLLEIYKPKVLEEAVLEESRFAQAEGIKSCAVFALRAADEILGLMFINYRTPHIFTDKEKRDIQLFADLAAIAIMNSRLYKQAEKRTAALVGLQEAGRAITGIQDLDATLNTIAEQALKVLGERPGEKGLFSHVGLLENGSLRFIAASPSEILSRVKERERMDIAGRAAKTRRVQNVGDVYKDQDYDIVMEYVKSQLSVPMKIVEQDKGERVIGVLSIEHPDLNAFSDEDVRIIELLAAQAAVAINNSQQFEELTKTRGLARMGMPLSTWRHRIVKNVYGILGQIELLQEELTKSKEYDRLLPRLEKLKRMTNRILQNPATRPGAIEEVRPVLINKFLRDRVERFWQYDSALEDIIHLDLLIEDTAAIRVNEEWLGEALDILIDNALNATSSRSKREITIRSDRIKIDPQSPAPVKEIEISVIDNGRGISGETRDDLFHKPIKKKRGERGTGTGLLIAQLIVHTYDGNIHCKSTGPSGTTMAISLPLEP